MTGVQTCALPILSTEVKIGDIIYWVNNNSNWLIYLQRNTEKNYFLGEMKEANYKIYWKDNYGVTNSQLGVFSRGGLEGIKTDLPIDYLTGSAQLLLSKTDISKKLKLYDKFFIEKDVWEVTLVDLTTYKNIIVYNLKLTEFNKDEDTDVPYGKINTITAIESNLDHLDEVKIDSKIPLKINTKVNGYCVNDDYEINCLNCLLEEEDNSIVFNKIEEVEITIKSLNSNVVKEYIISVKENPKIEDVYFITGPDTVKATLSYTFKINRNINGQPLLTIGEWGLDKDCASIVSSTSEECVVKIGKYTDTFKLEYILSNGEVVEKEINIKNIFDTL